MCQKIKQISQHNFRDSFSIKIISSPNFHLYTGLVSSGASFTSRGEGTSLALVDHPSSDDVIIKMPLLGRCFKLSIFAPNLFLLDCLKLNLALFLDQLRLA